MWPKLERRFVSESNSNYLVKLRNIDEWYQWDVSDERAPSTLREMDSGLKYRNATIKTWYWKGKKKNHRMVTLT